MALLDATVVIVLVSFVVVVVNVVVVALLVVIGHNMWSINVNEAHRG